MPKVISATVVGTASTGPGSVQQIQELAQKRAAVVASADLIEFDGSGLAAGADDHIRETVLAFKRVPVEIGHNVLYLQVNPSADVTGPALAAQVKSRIDALRFALDATGLLGVREYEVTEADPPDTGPGTTTDTPP